MSVEAAFYRDRDGATPATACGRVNRVSRDGISVCGFASAVDAARAASVAFHTFRTELARHIGLPLARLDASALAAGVGLLVERESGPAPFCFELRFPTRLSAEKAVRAARTISGALSRWSKERVAGAIASRESMPADEERDDVGEDSIHSFPASDPPGWISMWAGSPVTDAEHPEEVV
jgi:hypothetical protein